MPKRKLRKVFAVGLALFMAAGVDNGWAIGNIAKSITVQAKSIAKAEEEKKGYEFLRVVFLDFGKLSSFLYV